MEHQFYTVYALSSLKRPYIYVGLSSDLDGRVSRHQAGLERTTKPYTPFQLIYTKDFKTRIEARKHEKYLKSGAGKEFLKAIRDKS